MSSIEKNQPTVSGRRSVFISHASKNFKIADEVRALLEERGVSCWIAPRDIPPGGSYGTSIVEAIRECTIVVLLLTDEANKSKPVESEVERGYSNQKTIVPIRLREIKPSLGLEFFVSNAQWVDAIVSPLKGRIDQIINIVHAIEMDKPLPPTEKEVSTLLGRAERKLEQALRHKVLSVSIAFSVLILLTAGGLGLQMYSQNGLQAATESIKNMDTKLDGVKKETSDNPRKELANLGLALDLGDLLSSLSDPNIVELYKRSGMKASMVDVMIMNQYIAIDDSKYQQLVSNDFIGNCNPPKGDQLYAAGTWFKDIKRTAIFKEYCDRDGAFSKSIDAEISAIQSQIKVHEGTVAQDGAYDNEKYNLADYLEKLKGIAAALSVNN